MKNSIKNTFILSVLICAFLVQQPAYAGLFDFLKEPIDTAATGLRVSAGGKGTYRVCVK